MNKILEILNWQLQIAIKLLYSLACDTKYQIKKKIYK